MEDDEPDIEPTPDTTEQEKKTDDNPDSSEPVQKPKTNPCHMLDILSGINDGKWNVIFPCAEINAQIAFSFNLPENVTNIEHTINKQLLPYHSFEITSITTTTDTYNSQTVCANDSGDIYLGRVERVPKGEELGSGKTFIYSDGYFDYITDINLRNSAHSCSNLNTTKQEEVKTILTKLFENVKVTVAE